MQCLWLTLEVIRQNFQKLITLRINKKDWNLKPLFSRNIYKPIWKSDGELSLQIFFLGFGMLQRLMFLYGDLSHATCLLYHCWLALKTMWCLSGQLLSEQSHIPSLQCNQTGCSTRKLACTPSQCDWDALRHISSCLLDNKWSTVTAIVWLPLSKYWVTNW